MQLAQFLVEAVVLGKQSPNQLVREHTISRSWFYELLARYRRDGPAALEPKSHRPACCPHQVDQWTDSDPGSPGDVIRVGPGYAHLRRSRPPLACAPSPTEQGSRSLATKGR